MRRSGTVFLVGGGPGDPGLITRKGMEALQRADVVCYDHLANPKLLDLVRPGCRRLFVGKQGGLHFKEQHEIELSLIREARRGRVVVRLKGGDPFVFGRGGEEAEALRKAGVPFEIIPGVTSAIAAPAYAGIPVTHRDLTSTVAFVTGHEKSPQPPFVKGGQGGISGQIPWEALSQIGTVVFLMGVKNLPIIVKNLIASGRDSKTPVALIEWGTLPRQKVVTGTLRTIVRLASRIKPPAVTVVGDVVSLRDKLSWFERKPLFGKKILVTRSRGQASDLSRLLEEQGAEAIEIPTIELRPPTSFARMDAAIRRLASYDWIIFTSVNGVSSFFDRLWKKGSDLRDLAGVKVVAIGPATARAVEERGVRLNSVAQEFRAEGLVRLLRGVRGQRVLIPRAREARDVLIKELRRKGARVDVVEAYRTVIPRFGQRELRKALENGLDLITFASSSTVENFWRMVPPRLRRGVRKIPVASIGPITTRTARKLGFKVKIQPKSYTIPSLVAAILSAIGRP